MTYEQTCLSSKTSFKNIKLNYTVLLILPLWHTPVWDIALPVSRGLPPPMSSNLPLPSYFLFCRASNTNTCIA